MKPAVLAFVPFTRAPRADDERIARNFFAYSGNPELD
jgi:hypothetical protein